MGYLNNSGLKHLWDSIKNLFIKKESFEDAGITSKTYTEIDSETVTTASGAVHPKPYATLSDGSLTEAKMYRVTIGNDEYELPCYMATLSFSDLNKIVTMLFIGNPTYFDGNDDYIGHYWNVPFLISDSVITSSGSEPVKNGPYLFTSSAQTVEITVEEIAYTGKVVPGYLIDGGNPDLVEQNESDIRSSSFGYNRIARSTRGSAAIGTGNKVTGNYGVAIGTGCEAGSYANAIGIYAKATGYYAISIGWKTDASGAAAFASGAQTVASGNQSSTFGNRTIANHKGQFVFGEYNEADPSSAAATARGNYVEIVGNGTAADARSNARTLDWDGNERLAGGITLGDGTADETTITPAIAKSLIAGSSGNRGLFYGTCSTAAATTEKAVVCSDFTANDLVAGSVVMVLFSVTNSGAVASLTLNVNSTGAKSIKYISNGSYANIPSAGYLKANQIYQFTFDGTYWVVEMNYDTNNNAYKSYMADAKLTTYTNLYRYMLCFTKDEQTILPVNAVSNDTGTGKQLTTEAFDPFGPIWYYNSTTTVNAAAKAGSLYYFAADIDLRYSFNTAKTLTASKNVYIVCVPQSNGKVKLDSTNPISQTLPSSDDGKVYILLGVAYDTYRVCLHPIHPIYYYANGAIRKWTNAIPQKVHFVNATDISWSQDGSSAQSLSDTTRAQILSWLTNGEFVVLAITTSTSDPMWLYPDNDDSGDIYFRSLTTANGASAHYYEADISDGSTESHCDIARITMNLIPSGGTTGQVLTKTASGYAWQNLPVYNGGFT